MAEMTRSVRKAADGDREWSTRVTVVQQSQYDGGPFDFGDFSDGSLDGVIASLVAIYESIPAEYRHVALCVISSESGYEDSHYAAIEIMYDRPETPEETDRRVGRMNAESALVDRTERELYERLKAKFARPSSSPGE